MIQVADLWIKIKRLGVQRFLQTGWHRAQQMIHHKQLRKRAASFSAEHTWQELCAMYRYTGSFAQFLTNKRQSPTTQIPFTIPPSFLKDAQEITTHTFGLVGTPQQSFLVLPWHCDVRLSSRDAKADACFDATNFYADIKLSGRQNRHGLCKDVKVPWELSRFRHLLPLGLAYQAEQDRRYADSFCTDIDDWLRANPYLFGINWMNPMEVAIRAINWLIAFDYFKAAPTIDDQFWQRFCLSLYDHLYFLEHNWEWYDSRTNNHYLSNLVGYYVLTAFFEPLGLARKRRWCASELMKEIDKQILPDGMSYEGSTTYHRFVTELVMLFYLHAAECGEVPVGLEGRLKQMHEVLGWFSRENGDMITIGDNDSGSVCWYPFLPEVNPGFLLRSDELRRTRSFTTTPGYFPLIPSLKTWVFWRSRVREFPDFGVIVFRTPKVHFSFRQHVYTTVQPSGHFHNDMLSITLSVKGIPIIVDPGSFCYTASVPWRNYFRSAQQHNGIYLVNHEPASLTEDLFSLPLAPARNTGKIQELKGEFICSSMHQLYQGVTAHRIVFIKASETMILEDYWTGSTDLSTTVGSTCIGWNLIFDASIRLEKKEERWLAYHKGDLVLTIASEVPFTIEPNWLANEYGEKKRTHCLRAQLPFTYTTFKTELHVGR